MSLTAMIELPNFHDGDLDGFITSDKTFSLYLRSVSGHKFTVSLRDLRLFKGDNFREGNILFDVKVRDASNLARSEIVELLERSEEHLRSFDHERWLSKAREDSLLFVESTASYGAEFSAVCANIELNDGYQLP